MYKFVVLVFESDRNGQNDKSPLMGTFCGTEILPRFKSFSNHIYLRFKTDSSNELGGKVKKNLPNPISKPLFIWSFLIAFL